MADPRAQVVSVRLECALPFGPDRQSLLEETMMSEFESAVMRKVAWRLIPFLSIGYMINALGRFNVSMAALTMNKDLGLSASAYGFGAGAFFWTYILFQFPANLALARIGARVWISIIMTVWGICSASTALVTGETSFVAVRFLLGIAEAGFFPGVAYFMTCWFPASYRGRMMGIFYAAGAFAGVIGGPLGASLLKLNGTLGIAGWQWIFLVEGVPAVLLASYGIATPCVIGRLRRAGSRSNSGRGCSVGSTLKQRPSPGTGWGCCARSSTLRC
jgi:ACS family tartrate transporter-like MFS transporter